MMTVQSVDMTVTQWTVLSCFVFLCNKKFCLGVTWWGKLKVRLIYLSHPTQPIPTQHHSNLYWVDIIIGPGGLRAPPVVADESLAKKAGHCFN